MLGVRGSHGKATDEEVNTTLAIHLKARADRLEAAFNGNPVTGCRIDQLRRQHDDVLLGLVDRWHAGKGNGCPLHEWLGITEKEYARWAGGTHGE